MENVDHDEESVEIGGVGDIGFEPMNVRTQAASLIPSPARRPIVNFWWRRVVLSFHLQLCIAYVIT